MMWSTGNNDWNGNRLEIETILHSCKVSLQKTSDRMPRLSDFVVRDEMLAVGECQGIMVSVFVARDKMLGLRLEVLIVSTGN
uniref:Uncharacterized protein n=1 Tax=Glossina pallidipes TaxID=7398 RepID=A0A1B0A923_GLOPL